MRNPLCAIGDFCAVSLLLLTIACLVYLKREREKWRNSHLCSSYPPHITTTCPTTPLQRMPCVGKTSLDKAFEIFFFFSTKSLLLSFPCGSPTRQQAVLTADMCYHRFDGSYHPSTARPAAFLHAWPWLRAEQFAFAFLYSTHVVSGTPHSDTTRAECVPARTCLEKKKTPLKNPRLFLFIFYFLFFTCIYMLLFFRLKVQKGCHHYGPLVIHHNCMKSLHYLHSRTGGEEGWEEWKKRREYIIFTLCCSWETNTLVIWGTWVMDVVRIGDVSECERGWVNSWRVWVGEREEESEN